MVDEANLRKLLSEGKHIYWYNSLEATLKFPSTGFEISFKGIAPIYTYVCDQIDLWEQRGAGIPREFEHSKQFFIWLKQEISNVVIRHADENPRGYFDRAFKDLKKQIDERTNYVFNSDAPEVDFLISVLGKSPQHYFSAYWYITGDGTPNMHSKEGLSGILLAYEFSNKGSSLTDRINTETTSVNQLKASLVKSIEDMNNQLTEHLRYSQQQYEDYCAKIDEVKNKTEGEFLNWFGAAKGSYESFDNTTLNRVKELEDTYKEKLKLEQPAIYWRDRSVKLKRQGWTALSVLVGLVLLTVISLGEILWNTPEQIYTSFFDGDKSAAIRWSIVYITIISFMAFCIRAVSKVMFSSFHLSRDCEERFTLTYFYLSLLKESHVDLEEKKLIIQSLFSRADTGLLKDDSAPTMPTDVVAKIFNK
ncbi:DUF6161 domain-containing protein [Desertivirga arenae]|uniref:DUF6161 domain-containing protein n=1 Tax=Desertivirga arenae TaxID=2810309 RepID=UPI001A962898|nr:DUF6161 domain-containing protein [Pedobacter sp. SYSU D00823]